MNKKIRIITASICVVAVMMINSIAAVAAPYAFGNIEDIRSKALNNYLSAGSIMTMANAKSDANVEVLAISETEVEYKSVTVTETVNYSTVKRLNPALAAGETVTVREGVDGERAVVYSVRYENGVEVSSEYVESYMVKAPVSKIVEYGKEQTESVVTGTSSANTTSKLNYKYYIDCEATAYDMSPEENGGYAGQSATGVPLEKGVIAVDPRVIPLGTRVYVEAIDGSWSYGYAVAADTGGAIKGKRVDLCYRTQRECIQFGRRPCRVYILD